jgi:hypothetical protein
VLAAARAAAQAMQNEFKYINGLAATIQRVWRDRWQNPENRGAGNARGYFSLSVGWMICRVRIERALQTWRKTNEKAAKVKAAKVKRNATTRYVCIVFNCFCFGARFYLCDAFRLTTSNIISGASLTFTG